MSTRQTHYNQLQKKYPPSTSYASMLRIEFGIEIDPNMASKHEMFLALMVLIDELGDRAFALENPVEKPAKAQRAKKSTDV